MEPDNLRNDEIKNCMSDDLASTWKSPGEPVLLLVDIAKAIIPTSNSQEVFVPVDENNLGTQELATTSQVFSNDRPHVVSPETMSKAGSDDFMDSAKEEEVPGKDSLLRKSTFDALDFGPSVPESPKVPSTPVEGTIPIVFNDSEPEGVLDEEQIVLEKTIPRHEVSPEPEFEKLDESPLEKLLNIHGTSMVSLGDNVKAPVQIESPRMDDELPQQASMENTMRASFEPIDFESDAPHTDPEHGSEDEDEEKVEKQIDEMMQTLPREDVHEISRDSQCLSPLRETEDEGLFNATAIANPLYQTSQRPTCVTALDLQNIIEADCEDQDPVTQQALKRFQKTGRLSAHSDPPQMIHKLQKDRVTAILKGDYDGAKEYDEMSKRVSAAIAQAAVEEARAVKIEQTEEKLANAKKEYDGLKSVNQQKKKDQEENLRQKLYVLSEQHDQEIATFEKKWNSEDFLRRFTKPSSQLLQMKAIERSMVVAKMFDQAKTLRRTALFTERREANEQQQRAKKEMEQERQRMVDRQAREFETLQHKCHQLMEITMKQIETDERPCLRKIQRLERELDELKNGSVSVSAATARGGCVTERGPKAEKNPLVSARTTFRYSAYKASTQSTKLKIQPLGAVAQGPRKSRVIRLRAATSMK